MDAKQIALIMGCPLARAQEFTEALNHTMAAYQINTPERVAAFLAQVGHESEGLRYVRELWGPTPAQVKYEGRVDLGNVQPGDGKRFLGRGLIQITGRSNYETAGAEMGLPLLSRPTLLERPFYAALSAGWFWQRKGLNDLADAGDFERITRKINGGYNGLDDRLARWDRAKEALAVA